MTDLADPSATIPRWRAIAYWVTTALIAAELALGGVWDLLRVPGVREGMAHLGYPDYLMTILGIWKIPGAVVLLIPRFPRLKEWAYAGAVFTYTGAVASIVAVGDSASTLVPPTMFAGLAAASWALRSPGRRLNRPRV